MKLFETTQTSITISLAVGFEYFEMTIEQGFVNESMIWALRQEWATCLATLDAIYVINKLDF